MEAGLAGAGPVEHVRDGRAETRRGTDCRTGVGGSCESWPGGCGQVWAGRAGRVVPICGAGRACRVQWLRSDGSRTAGHGGAGWWHRAGEGGRTDVGRASVAGCGRVGTCRVHHVGAGRPHRPLGASERDTPRPPGSGGLLCAPDAEGVNRSGDMCPGAVCGCGSQMSRGWAAYLKARGGSLQRSQRPPWGGKDNCPGRCNV